MHFSTHNSKEYLLSIVSNLFEFQFKIKFNEYNTLEQNYFQLNIISLQEKKFKEGF